VETKREPFQWGLVDAGETVVDHKYKLLFFAAFLYLLIRKIKSSPRRPSVRVPTVDDELNEIEFDSGNGTR
jgi:hypothetical protein